MNSDALIIGLPSKGRLREGALAFFSAVGLPVTGQGGRGYAGRLQGLDGVEAAFLSAAEIATSLESGGIHLGITGEDLLREGIIAPEDTVEVIASLDFGAADVVVAVPRSWIDVRCMDDLDDVARAFHARHGRQMRVATKYTRLTRAFFSDHGVTDYRLVQSLGATEGAPAAGGAEIIVDITSTGATLAANDLKTMEDGTILRSQAVLAASLQAAWSTPVRTAAAQLLDMVAAQRRAARVREVRFSRNGGEDDLLQEIARRFQCETLPYGSEADSASVVTVHCPADHLHALAAFLRARGKHTLTVTRAEYMFTPDNTLYEQLARTLKRAP